MAQPPDDEPLQGQLGEDKRADGDRQIDPEDPAPCQMIDEEAAENRTDDARDGEGAGDVGLVAAALAGRDDVGDRRMRHRQQPAAAQPLEGAKADELRHRGGEAAQHRGQQEDHDGDLQHDLAAVEVGQLAVDRRCRRRGQEIGRNDPGEMLDAVEIGRNARQRRRDDGLVERGEEHAEHQADQDDDRLAMVETARGRLGVRQSRQCSRPRR